MGQLKGSWDQTNSAVQPTRLKCPRRDLPYRGQGKTHLGLTANSAANPTTEFDNSTKTWSQYESTDMSSRNLLLMARAGSGQGCEMAVDRAS